MKKESDFTILVVDDEEDLREAICFEIEFHGFKVISAVNGVEAFKLMNESKVHLVVSDIRMPGGDGIVLLDSIRAGDPKLPPVILITGFADISTEQALLRGANDFLNKPFDGVDLIQSIRKNLNESYGVKLKVA